MATSTTTYDALKLAVGAGSATALEGVTACSQNDSKAETDSVYIGSSVAKTTLGARTVSFDLTLDYDPADTNHQALQDAYEGNTDVIFHVITNEGGATGEIGKSWPCGVSSFTLGLDPGGTLTASVTLRPSDDPTAV